MWRRVLGLMLKEFLALLKDKRGRVVLIVPPVVQLMVFGYAATYDLNHVPFAVYDEDGGAAAADLLSRFSGSPAFSMKEAVVSDDRIATLINDKEALLVLHIGPDFSRDLLSGRGARVQVIVDGRNSNTAMLASNYAQTIVNGFNEDWVTSHGLPGPPARLETRSWFNPNLESRWFFIPGIVGLLTLVITMLVTALSVAREREQGTFDQLLVTPLRPVEIILGKALPGFVIGFAEASLIIAVAVFWFRVPLLGHIVVLHAGLGLFLFSSIGVGLMISSLAVTQQQGLLGAFLFLVPAIILSGFATPIANMPRALQLLTYIDPLRYFMVILRGVFLEGATFRVLVPQFWPMAVIGLCAMIFAGWLFRHRMN
ncbi:MAG: ABC transporter permease [Thermodesulfobacteriota bacterium]